MRPHSQVVLRALAVTPGQIRFFDDSRSNVEAARALSIPAFQVTGFAELQRRLRDLGLDDTPGS